MCRPPEGRHSAGRRGQCWHLSLPAWPRHPQTKARSMTTPSPLQDVPHPVCQSGSKNVFCPYYERCLDYAAERNWGYWNCSVCPHRLRQIRPEGIPNTNDAEIGYQLPLKTYREVICRLDCVKKGYVFSKKCDVAAMHYRRSVLLQPVQEGLQLLHR